MSSVVSLLLLVAFMAGGYISARARLLPFNAFAGRLFSAALYLLLFSMGLRLGQSRDVLANLSTVGLLAAFGALFACAGTVIAHIAFSPLYRKLDSAGFFPSGRSGDGAGLPCPDAGLSACDADQPAASAGRTSRYAGSRRLALLLYSLRKPLILLVLVIAGTAAGFALPEISALRDGTIATWLLYFLLFIIGMQMAGSDVGIGTLFLQPAVILLPVVTLAGTLAGSLGMIAFGLTPGHSLALGSGFGWYSLSGVLIADLGDPLLGAAAFLANLFREMLAFLAIPALRLTGRCESGIGIAGATSMDVTLPVIEDTWGSGVIPLSVAHGAILSTLVPFIVPLFMSF